MAKDDYSISRWISILYRYGQGFISRRVEKYNLGSGHYVFLIALYNNEGISQKQMAEYLKIDKSSTAKAVRQLEKEGYIKREIDNNDKRAYKIYLTEKALDIKSELYRVIQEWEALLLSDLSPQEKEMSLKLLKKMAENVSETALKKTQGVT